MKTNLALRNPNLNIHIQNEYRHPFYVSLSAPKSIRYGVTGKLYLTRNQKKLIWKFFGDVRFVWNQFLEAFINQFKDALDFAKATGHPLYNKNGKYQSKNKKFLPKNLQFPTSFQIVSKLLTGLKKKYTWLYQADGKALQDEVKRLYDTYKKRVFRHLSKEPHFKSRKSHYQSLMTDSSSVTGHSLFVGSQHGIIPKLGYVKFHLNRHVYGEVKSVTIESKPNGDYYISLSVVSEKQAIKKTGRAVGIDLGIAHLLNLSDGQKINFKYFMKHESKRLRQWKHKFSKRCAHAYSDIKRNKATINHQEKEHPGSKNNQVLIKKLRTHYYQFSNINKARLKVAKIYAKVANRRYDYIQKITTWLVRNYDFIAMEDLDIKKMMMSKTSAKHKKIAEASWGMIESLLIYKCSWYGKTLVLVNPAYTSQICCYDHTWCGKHPTSVRSWKCKNKSCQAKHGKMDRDICSAKLILQLGLHFVSPFVYRQIPKYQHSRLPELEKFTRTKIVSQQPLTLQSFGLGQATSQSTLSFNVNSALNRSHKMATFP